MVKATSSVIVLEKYNWAEGYRAGDLKGKETGIAWGEWGAAHWGWNKAAEKMGSDPSWASQRQGKCLSPAPLGPEGASTHPFRTF